MDYDCKSLLDKYKSSKLFEPVLNIVLVLKRLRQSTLFETGSFTKEECKEHRSICDSLPMIHIYHLTIINISTIASRLFSKERFFCDKKGATDGPNR